MKLKSWRHSLIATAALAVAGSLWAGCGDQSDQPSAVSDPARSAPSSKAAAAVNTVTVCANTTWCVPSRNDDRMLIRRTSPC